MCVERIFLRGKAARRGWHDYFFTVLDFYNPMIVTPLTLIKEENFISPPTNTVKVNKI